MKVFVTVGTTHFDSLVAKVCEKAVQDQLVSSGYSSLLIQAGKSAPSSPASDSPLVVTWYNYKPSLQDDMVQADLVISHAGAGTCLEVLELGKPLIVVVNDQLMGNHQVELAEQLAKDNHLVYATPSTLLETIRNFSPDSLTPYKRGNTKLFSDFIDNLMGVNTC